MPEGDFETLSVDPVRPWRCPALAKAAEIQVTGAKELRKALRKVETDAAWRPAFKNAYSTAATHVETTARGKSQSSRMGSVARATIKGKGTTTNAAIVAGGSLPYFHGFEFGSHRYKQFPSVRPGGYHLYPSIADQRERIGEIFMDEVDRMLAGEAL